MKLVQSIAKAGLGLLCTIAISMPLFAQSINHVTKVVTVGEGMHLKSAEKLMPWLVIDVKDGLTEGERFYLNLEGATWDDEQGAVQVLGSQADETLKIDTQKINETQLEVKVQVGEIEAGKSIRIPMQAVIKGKEAKVMIDSNNTTLTSERLTFANSSNEKAKIIAEQVPKKAEATQIANLILEEAYSGQFKSSLEKEANSVMHIYLNNKDLSFDFSEAAKSQFKVIGMKGYEGINSGLEGIEIISEREIAITLPTQIKEKQIEGKGSFKIEGLKVKGNSKNIVKQEVTLGIESDWVETKNLKVLEIVEYEANIKKKQAYEMLTGRKQKVAFIMEESMEGAIVRNRSLDVYLTNGITLEVDQENNVQVKIEGKTYKFPAIIEEQKVIGFEIPSLELPEIKDKLAYEIGFEVIASPQAQGTSELILEGRGLPKTLKIPFVEVKPVVSVKIEAMCVKTGLKDQVGGKIRLQESGAGSLQVGEKLLIQIEQDNIKLTEAPLVEVLEGDIELGKPELVEGGIEVEITKKSTQPARIEIAHFRVDVNGMAADGRYKVAIGGKAIAEQSVGDLSPSTDMDDIKPIVKEDFILVNVKPKDLKEITFTAGEGAYAINGKYKHLDVPAYMEQGRMIVPIKDVAEALNIPKEQVNWNKETEKITIYTDKIIELEVGSNIIKVDGKKEYMATQTTMVQGKVMVPIGEIARALGIDVDWNDKTQTAKFVSYQ